MSKLSVILLLFALHFAWAVPLDNSSISQEETFKNSLEQVCPQRNATLYFINNDSDLLHLRITDAPQSSELFLKDPSIEPDATLSLAFNYDHNEMLFTSKLIQNRIRAVDNGSNVRLFASHNKRFGRIAIDPVTKNVYYTENGVGVGVCDKDVNKCVTLVEAESTEVRYLDLILNPKLGQMLWIQEDLAPILKISSMDGKKVRVLSAFEHVHAISLDEDNEILYIAEEDVIIRLDLKSFTRSTFAEIRTSAMIYFNCDLYYVDRNHQTLQVYTSAGDIIEIAALNGASFPFEVVPEDFKVKRFNPCQFMDCQGVCVLAEGTVKPVAQCVCSSCLIRDLVKAKSSAYVWIISFVLLFLVLSIFAVFAVLYFRLWPALCDRLDEMIGRYERDTTNIGVNYNGLDV